MILATLNVIAPVADPSPSDGIAMAGLRQIFLGQNCRNNCTQGQYWGMAGAKVTTLCCVVENSRGTKSCGGKWLCYSPTR
jgi:hypothetical protein